MQRITIMQRTAHTTIDTLRTDGDTDAGEERRSVVQARPARRDRIASRLVAGKVQHGARHAQWGSATYLAELYGAQRLPRTLEVILAAAIIATGIGVPLGTYAAIRADGKADAAISFFASAAGGCGCSPRLPPDIGQSRSHAPKCRG